jgi:hypothetical protein
MSKIDSKKVYEKFKEKAIRTEAEVIKNKGIEITIGLDVIIVKQLLWDDAEKFENKIVELLSNFSNINIDTEKLDFSGIAQKVLSNILGTGLLELAEIASEGKVTLEYIREVGATKDDVIKLVIESILLNYAYIKNLIAISQRILSK